MYSYKTIDKPVDINHSNEILLQYLLVATAMFCQFLQLVCIWHWPIFANTCISGLS